MLKVRVVSFPHIFQVLYVLYSTRPRYQVSVYRTIGPLVLYLPAPAQSAYSHSNLFIVRIPPLFYTNASEFLKTSYDQYKCIVINKNGLQLLKGHLQGSYK